jgi:hypothetical protein
MQAGTQAWQAFREVAYFSLTFLPSFAQIGQSESLTMVTYPHPSQTKYFLCLILVRCFLGSVFSVFIRSARDWRFNSCAKSFSVMELFYKTHINSILKLFLNPWPWQIRYCIQA